MIVSSFFLFCFVLGGVCSYCMGEREKGEKC